ncbi:MAG: ATP-grasp domain-containing protein [Pseudomonadota bacterium]
MFLIEYLSKELLAQYGVRCPTGHRAKTASEAQAACVKIKAKKYVVKAQIPAGGRGPAGGIKLAATPSVVHDEAEALLGRNLVTEQTESDGELVDAVYVEEAHDLASEAYIAFALDPYSGATLLLTSGDGGTTFEGASRSQSNAVHSKALNQDALESEIAEALSGIGINDPDATMQIFGALEAFHRNDMLLLEINPFAQTREGGWMAIDAKVHLDPSAAFRHPEFERLFDDYKGQHTESEAQKSNINLVALDGSIGVVVNGAGLGLATNDMIVDQGGQPANFMDIRTTATSFDIARGVELLLQDANVKVLLLNVHGGGMTVCDTVAEGVALAYSRSDNKLRCIARLAGVNADWGRQILKDRKVPVENVTDLDAAVGRATEIAGAA